MTPDIVRTDKEINDQLDRIYDGLNSSKYPGMSYEQGCEAMYKWLIGETEDLPMEDDD